MPVLKLPPAASVEPGTAVDQIEQQQDNCYHNNNMYGIAAYVEGKTAE